MWYQAAAHESWLVRCSLHAPGFRGEQSASIPLILQESADATCTHPPDVPPPSFLHANFVAIRENRFSSSKELNQSFRGGTSTSQPPPYILILILKDFFMHHHSPGQTLGILSFPVAAHFSLLHHAPIFSWIHSLGGQGRYVWGIVRFIVKRSESSIQSLASRVQRLKSSVQSPASSVDSCVQSPGIPVCPFYMRKQNEITFTWSMKSQETYNSNSNV